MNPYMHHGCPGRLFVFEGIDGCGKGTQIRLLKDYLDTLGVPTVLSATPGGTQFGQEVRRILFDSTSGMTTHRLDGDVCSLLYLASHLQSFHEIVAPSLREGKVVISDRWDAISGQVFAFGGAVPVSDPVREIRWSMSGPRPDRVFFLWGDPGTLLERAKSRTEEVHQNGKRWANVEKLTEIQERYHTILDSMKGPSTHVVKIQVDGKTPEQIHEEVRNNII